MGVHSVKFPDPNKDLIDQDEDCLLAMACWGEARGEPPTGRTAMVHSVLNRCVAKKRTLKQILLALWQYSCFNANDPNFHQVFHPSEHGGLGTWALCWRAAVEAIAGQTSDPTEGATHYVVKSLWNRPPLVALHPKWFEAPEIASGRTKLKLEVGNHVFATCPW